MSRTSLSTIKRRLREKKVPTPREAHEQAREALFRLRERVDAICDRDDGEDATYRGLTRAQWLQALEEARRLEEELWQRIANWPPKSGAYGPRGKH